MTFLAVTLFFSVAAFQLPAGQRVVEALQREEFVRYPPVFSMTFCAELSPQPRMVAAVGLNACGDFFVAIQTTIVVVLYAFSMAFGTVLHALQVFVGFR